MLHFRYIRLLSPYVNPINLETFSSFLCPTFRLSARLRLCGTSYLRYGYYVLATANHELHVEYAHKVTTGHSDVRRTQAYAAMAVADLTKMTMTRDDGRYEM